MIVMTKLNNKVIDIIKKGKLIIRYITILQFYTKFK